MKTNSCFLVLRINWFRSHIRFEYDVILVRLKLSIIATTYSYAKQTYQARGLLNFRCEWHPNTVDDCSYATIAISYVKMGLCLWFVSVRLPIKKIGAMAVESNLRASTPNQMQLQFLALTWCRNQCSKCYMSTATGRGIRI